MANYFYGTPQGDTIDWHGLSAGVTTNPVGLTKTLPGDNVIYGFGGDDTLVARDGDNRIYGGDGIDQIFTRAGNSKLYGGPGNDLISADGEIGQHVILDGGTGADYMHGWFSDDIYYVDDASDYVYEPSSSLSYDTVYSSIGVYLIPEANDDPANELIGSIEALILAGSKDQNGVGNSEANSITGNAWSNFLDGRGGDDDLHGAAGKDILRGGDGKDTLIGGADNDTFLYSSTAESTTTAPDVIKAGEDAAAFQGVGNRGMGDADRINLADIDANKQAGNNAFAFGGFGEGHLTVLDAFGSTDTIVVGNTDADADFELEIIIEDGDVPASAYTAGDFIL